MAVGSSPVAVTREGWFTIMFHPWSTLKNDLGNYELKNDLQKISEWPYKWKMSFNPDLNKEGQEVIFSRKLNKPSHSKIVFNSTIAVSADW